MSLDRLILYEDVPPAEQPLNPHDELWIEIRPNDPSQGDHWLLRRITAQCGTGEVRIADKFGKNEQVIDLTQYAYHWVKPPRSGPDAVSIKETTDADESNVIEPDSEDE